MQLAVDAAPAVILFDRKLKDRIEAQAYGMLTEPERTAVERSLPEEIRWLAVYPEVKWRSAPDMFWRRFAVLTARKEHAPAWIDDRFVDLLLGLPLGAAPTPLMLAVERGQCTLRTQLTPGDRWHLDTLDAILAHACDRAARTFPRART
ncbi:hypothetical protein [Ramlibacter humi]|uniref:Uncharacterized protein n=1 Tax=Ramlibacter humi TaxID=2530451 RepID=A0A4Z0BPD8_9BURK|nr:hypothetical protein [Ramlibacter humi]TFZ00280.1 hypothetical protein EZ216_14365 [Ramlibacter humi]